MQKIVIVILTIFCCLAVQAQVPKYNKAYLQKQNEGLKKEISQLSKELQQNQSQSKTSVVYIQKLDEKIAKQSKLVSNLTKEKTFIEDEIYAYGKQINDLNKELNLLKKEYKDVLIRAYKNKSTQSRLLFVLSAKNFTEAYRRVKYLEKYSEFQQAKVDEITSTQKEIQAKQQKRKLARQEKEKILGQQVVFNEQLESEKLQKQKIVNEFKKNAHTISAKIRAKTAKQKQVDSQIKAIILEEIRLAKIKEEEERKKREAAEAERKRQLEIAKQKALEAERKRQEELAKQRAKEEAERLAKEEAERKRLEAQRQAEIARIADETERKKQEQLAKQKAEAEKTRLAKLAEQRKTQAANARKAAEAAAVKKAEDSQPKLTAYRTSADLSNDFESNRGRLPMPVSQGNIVSQFGVHPHPVLSGIKVENSGIDIATRRGESATSVFNGTVSVISKIPGGNQTVLVKHGNYFTVYHNLSNVFVQKGDNIKRGQKLGRIYTDTSGQTILNFQVWKGTSKQNPSIWVASN